MRTLNIIIIKSEIWNLPFIEVNEINRFCFPTNYVLKFDTNYSYNLEIN